MYTPELNRFLRDGLTAEQVTGRGTGAVTRIVGIMFLMRLLSRA